MMAGAGPQPNIFMGRPIPVSRTLFADARITSRDALCSLLRPVDLLRSYVISWYKILSYIYVAH